VPVLELSPLFARGLRADAAGTFLGCLSVFVSIFLRLFFVIMGLECVIFFLLHTWGHSFQTASLSTLFSLPPYVHCVTDLHDLPPLPPPLQSFVLYLNVYVP